MEGFGSSDMEGFGKSDFDSYEHYSYGSVKDGYLENHTLEYRLKKKYWKTKQTVRQKLHKDEDEYIVAGDADIDAKLEVLNDSLYCCDMTIMITFSYSTVQSFW